MSKRNFLGFFMGLMPFMNNSMTIEMPQGQGIDGYVYRITGNQMPSPDKKPAKPKGLKTFIYVFGLTSVDQTERKDQSAFYSAIHTKLVKKAQSGKDGYFKVNLPTGQYSLFIKKDSLFYANWFDGNNHIAPVKVEPGKMTRIEVKADYDASY